MSITKEERERLRAYKAQTFNTPNILEEIREMADFTLRSLDALDAKDKRIAELEREVEHPDGVSAKSEMIDGLARALDAAGSRIEELEQACEYMLAAYHDSETNLIRETSSHIASSEAELTSECDGLARRYLGKGIAEVLA